MTEPVILTGSSGDILEYNSAAARLLAAGDGISMLDNRLRFADPSAEQAYFNGLRDCENGDGTADVRVFVVSRPSGSRPYIVSLRPLPSSWDRTEAPLPGDNLANLLLTIRDPEDFGGIDPGLLAESYDLSPAEIDLAVAMYDEATVRDVADRRGVAITTVRTQLYALMGKMYVNRQIDLIRLLQQYRSPF